MIKFLNDIRNVEKPISNNRKIINTIAVLFQGKLFSGWFNANIINTKATISIITPIILDILLFM